jgi:hypothetical protein
MLVIIFRFVKSNQMIDLYPWPKKTRKVFNKSLAPHLIDPLVVPQFLTPIPTKVKRR